MTTFEPIPDPSSFRRIAVAIWRPAKDPSIYGMMSIEMTAALAFLDEARAREGAPKLSVTHLVAKAIALAFARHPELNAKVRLGRLVQRKSVDLFLQVSEGGGKDLSGVKIARADERSLDEIAGELAGKAKSIREGADPAMKQSRSLIRRLPHEVVRAFLAVGDFLTNTLGLDLSGLGMPADPFGTAMVTSVGMFGIEMGFAPFLPIGRCAALILVGEVQKRPWVVEDGRVEARPVMNLCATFDHRIIDGYHAGLLARDVKELLADPRKLA